MSRRNVARLILVLWTVALGWLAYRQFFPDERARLAAGAARLPPDARYFRVMAGELQIGVLTMTWDTLPTGFRITGMLALDLPVGEGTTRQLAVTEHLTSRALTWKRSARTFSGGGVSEEAVAESVADSVTQYRLQIRNQPSMANQIWSAPTRPTVPLLLPMKMTFGEGLQPGSALEMAAVDLIGQRLVRLQGEVLGTREFVVPDSVELDPVSESWRTVTTRTLPAWEIRVRQDGTEERWWVDRLGRPVRWESPLGVSLEMTAFDYAQTTYREHLQRDGPGARTGLTGLRSLAGSGVRLDTTASEIRALVTLANGPVTPAARYALGGHRQAVEGDTLIVTRRWMAGTASAPEASDTGSSRSLAPRGRVRAAADSALAGGFATRRDSVAALTRWVTTRIARDTSAVRYRDAAEAIRTRTASPDGMAALLAAMAREAGIEARTVGGVAVTGEGLLAHSWVELWSGAEWAAADPWSGHFPASARLVRVAGTGRGRPFEVLTQAAALRLEPITPGVR
jgi:hypothetical protein